MSPCTAPCRPPWPCRLACSAGPAGPFGGDHLVGGIRQPRCLVASTDLSRSLKKLQREFLRPAPLVGQGDYRVTQVAQVAPEHPGGHAAGRARHGRQRRDRAAHARPRGVQLGDVTVGRVVSARERPYGYELARADTRTAFFLLLDDPWYRELQSVIVRL
jgi:hypothetical protein